MSSNVKFCDLNTNGEVFIHYSYAWKKESIYKDGIKKSLWRTIGEGVYCLKKDSEQEVISNVINYLSENVDLQELRKFYKLKYIPKNEMNLMELIMDSIIEIPFYYSGGYLLSLGNSKGEYKDYIKIKTEGIQTENLI